MFSLGQTPYPHLEIGTEIIEALRDNGERLNQPDFAPNAIYQQVMTKCWIEEPLDRPSFEEIGHSLEQLVNINLKHLPTFDKTYLKELSVQFNVNQPVDNQMYFSDNSSPVSIQSPDSL